MGEEPIKYPKYGKDIVPAEYSAGGPIPDHVLVDVVGEYRCELDRILAGANVFGTYASAEWSAQFSKPLTIADLQSAEDLVEKSFSGTAKWSGEIRANSFLNPIGDAFLMRGVMWVHSSQLNTMWMILEFPSLMSAGKWEWWYERLWRRLREAWQRWEWTMARIQKYSSHRPIVCEEYE